MTDFSCAGTINDLGCSEDGEARLLGLTASETGLELLWEVQHDIRGLGSWIELFRKEGHSRPASGTHRNASREVMPLPVPKRGLQLLTRLNSCREKFPIEIRAWLSEQFSVTDIWQTLTIVGLNALFSNLRAPRAMGSRPLSAAQRSALQHIKLRAMAFERATPGKDPVPRSPSAPLTKRLKGKKVTYRGEVAVVACQLTLEQVEAGLPPPGMAGLHELEGSVDSELNWYLSDVTRCLLPDDEVKRPLPHAKVMASREAWVQIAVRLVELGICRLMTAEEIARSNGEMVLRGAFGVIKAGKTTPSGGLVLRFIMDVRMTNAMFRTIQGDLHAIAGGQRT